jgi:hypothetical protein
MSLAHPGTRDRIEPADDAANGPPPAPLPYGRHTLDEADVAAVVRALRGEWLTQGPTVARFEEAIAARCGAPHCVAVSSGTAAPAPGIARGGCRRR